MSYRDELQAARARIEQLEQQIATMHEEAEHAARRRELEANKTLPAVPALRDRVRNLREAEARVAEMEAQLAERVRAVEAGPGELERLRGELEQATARIAELERLASAERAMVSITEHNRRLAPSDSGTPASVLCPMCLALGDRVEMRRSAVRL